MTAHREHYEKIASEYDSLESLPCSKLEVQLVTSALGNCGGAKVLDLGGGSGLHARKAVEAGAVLVDVVDISPAMMQVGKERESHTGYGERIHWHEADVARSLDHLSLEKQTYDIVMANWVLDHATSYATLAAMWQNIADYIKPGGKLINVRVANLLADHLEEGRYGVRYADIEKIPGGYKYRVVGLTEPEFHFSGASMEESYSLSKTIAEDHGSTNVHCQSAEDMDMVKADKQFWQPYLDDPNWVVVVATKG